MNIDRAHGLYQNSLDPEDRILAEEKKREDAVGSCQDLGKPLTPVDVGHSQLVFFGDVTHDESSVDVGVDYVELLGGEGQEAGVLVEESSKVRENCSGPVGTENEVEKGSKNGYGVKVSERFLHSRVSKFISSASKKYGFNSKVPKKDLANDKESSLNEQVQQKIVTKQTKLLKQTPKHSAVQTPSGKKPHPYASQAQPKLVLKTLDELFPVSSVQNSPKAATKRSLRIEDKIPNVSLAKVLSQQVTKLQEQLSERCASYRESISSTDQNQLFSSTNLSVKNSENANQYDSPLLEKKPFSKFAKTGREPKTPLEARTTKPTHQDLFASEINNCRKPKTFGEFESQQETKKQKYKTLKFAKGTCEVDYKVKTSSNNLRSLLSNRQTENTIKMSSNDSVGRILDFHSYSPMRKITKPDPKLIPVVSRQSKPLENSAKLTFVMPRTKVSQKTTTKAADFGGGGVTPTASALAGRKPLLATLASTLLSNSQNSHRKEKNEGILVGKVVSSTVVVDKILSPGRKLLVSPRAVSPSMRLPHFQTFTSMMELH